MARRAGAGPVDVSVLLVGDAAIRALNRRWRRRDRATDVLAFPPPRSRPRRRPQPRPLGDIVVSLETCRREARAAGVAACGRLAHLLAHGLLHLLGRDHATTRAFEALERRTRELAAAALGRNPPRR
jgi:probable rRNA maturation factor